MRRMGNLDTFLETAARVINPQYPRLGRKEVPSAKHWADDDDDMLGDIVESSPSNGAYSMGAIDELSWLPDKGRNGEAYLNGNEGERHGGTRGVVGNCFHVAMTGLWHGSLVSSSTTDK